MINKSFIGVGYSLYGLATLVIFLPFNELLPSKYFEKFPFYVVVQIFAVGNGNAHLIWETIDGHLSFLGSEDQGQINWSM